MHEGGHGWCSRRPRHTASLRCQVRPRLVWDPCHPVPHSPASPDAVTVLTQDVRTFGLSPLAGLFPCALPPTTWVCPCSPHSALTLPSLPLGTQDGGGLRWPGSGRATSCPLLLLGCPDPRGSGVSTPLQCGGGTGWVPRWHWMESVLSSPGCWQRVQVWGDERSQKCPSAARGAAGGCAGGLQCKGHVQLAEGTAPGLVTEGPRVACPTETLQPVGPRGLRCGRPKPRGGGCSHRAPTGAWAQPGVPVHSLSCRGLPSLLPFSFP